MRKILLFILVFISFLGNSVAYEVDSNFKQVHKNFISSLEKKFNITDKKAFLSTLNESVSSILKTSKNLSAAKKQVLQNLIILNNEEIFLIDSKWFNNSKQEFLEKNERNKLIELEKGSYAPTFFSYLNNWNIKFKWVNEKMEFTENNEIKRLNFSKYYKINEKNYKAFAFKKWYILKVWASYWFVEEYELEKKIPYSESKNYVLWLFDYGSNFFKKGEVFYTYSFTNFTFFEDNYGFYLSDLKKSWIDASKTLIYFWENWKYNFVSNFKETKLISDSIIYWITDKIEFLSNLINDKLYLKDDTDELFIRLKKETLTLTKWLSNEETIKKLYDFILNKVEYTTKIDLSDKKIFSGILTYKNSDWVCEWYVKLFAYSLQFAWIPNVNVIRWDVLDAQDFPNIWHAWIKIWNYYYDPTFDDPIWNKKTKNFPEYLYYKIPKDLFYTNRYDFWDTPEYLKKTSFEERRNLINKNLYDLETKYRESNYNILKLTKFKKSHNISYKEKITIDTLKNIFPYYEVNNYKIIENWNTKSIIWLLYYKVTNENIEAILEQSDYKISGFYLFKWKDKNGITDYRIGYNLKFG